MEASLLREVFAEQLERMERSVGPSAIATVRFLPFKDRLQRQQWGQWWGVL